MPRSTAACQGVAGCVGLARAEGSGQHAFSKGGALQPLAEQLLAVHPPAK